MRNYISSLAAVAVLAIVSISPAAAHPAVASDSGQGVAGIFEPDVANTDSEVMAEAAPEVLIEDAPELLIEDAPEVLIEAEPDLLAEAPADVLADSDADVYSNTLVELEANATAKHSNQSNESTSGWWRGQARGLRDVS